MARIIAVPYQTRVEVNSTITEKRAPTDQSVALLKEMEEAARDKIVDSVSVGGNGFNAVLHKVTDYLSDDTLFRTIFDLNGHRETVDVRIPHYKAMELGEVGIGKQIMQAVSDRIASAVLGHAYGTLPGGFARSVAA